MITTEKTTITIETTINATVEKVWTLWTKPEHIVNWNNASPEWHTPQAKNDLREGGQFVYRMEARDGSMGFDLKGTFTKVTINKEIEYMLEDGRKVQIQFTPSGNTTYIRETFDPEHAHPLELQRTGWQAILDHFKLYAESVDKMQTLHFEISINAPVEKVYDTMIHPQGYKEWTKAFCDTSYYSGSWEKGSKMLFIGVNKEGKQEGMVSRIKENIPYQLISIEHLGILNGPEEITSGPAVDGWNGALENYNFSYENGKTTLVVNMDSNEQFKTFFEQTWPKALQKLKEMCEQ
jgi:uncharacterized protein YndB with AHSA1/START domain